MLEIEHRRLIAIVHMDITRINKINVNYAIHNVQHAIIIPIIAFNVQEVDLYHQYVIVVLVFIMILIQSASPAIQRVIIV